MLPYQLIFGEQLLPQRDGTILRGEAVMLPLDQLAHAYFKGMTGRGKSSLLVGTAVSLIWQGVGVTLIDPAGDLSRQVLARLVATGYFEKFPDALERVVYLDIPRAHREERYFPFNILKGNYDPYTAADVVLEGFKRVWPALQDGTWTNVELLLRLGSFALADLGLPLLPYLENLYTVPAIYKKITAALSDSRIRKWIATLGVEPKGKYVAEIAMTTLKREFLLAFSPIVRYALSQKANLLDFTDLLNNNRSVLLNLSVADPDAKRLIGCLLTQQAEAVAKSRGRLTQEQKSKRYVIIIDEVQNYVYQSGLALENMFAEARKANVSVWVAHQYGAQLPEELHGALSECDIIVVFKVGHKDALISAEQLEFPIDPHRVKQETGNPFSEAGTRKTFYTPEEHRVMQAGWIQSLQPRIAYISLPDGRLDLMRTLEVPQHTNEQRLQEIEQEYLRRYFRSKAEIDREIEDTLADFASSQNTEQNAQLQETSSRASAQTPNAVIGLEELPINNDKEPRAKDLPALPTTSAQTDKKPESMQSPRLKRQVKRKDDFDVF